jgi:hypothetical protein
LQSRRRESFAGGQEFTEDRVKCVNGRGTFSEGATSGEERLPEAVLALYCAAIWHTDRPVADYALWEAVREAAEFEPGESPKPIE